MNIKDYEYVYEIARQKSVSKAAEKLYITQSALTKYLQRLENELSTPLFFRSGNRFVPTHAPRIRPTHKRTSCLCKSMCAPARPSWVTSFRAAGGDQASAVIASSVASMLRLLAA